MSILRIFYASRMSEPLTVPSLRRLLGAAQVSNRRAAITGVLVFTGNHFSQVLEGPEAAVRGLAARIAEDKRHTGFRILACGDADQRDYPDWSMELFESPQLEAEIAELTGAEAPAPDLVSRVLARIQREIRWKRVADDAQPFGDGHGQGA